MIDSCCINTCDLLQRRSPVTPCGGIVKVRRRSPLTDMPNNIACVIFATLKYDEGEMEFSSHREVFLGNPGNRCRLKKKWEVLEIIFRFF